MNGTSHLDGRGTWRVRAGQPVDRTAVDALLAAGGVTQARRRLVRGLSAESLWLASPESGELDAVVASVGGGIFWGGARVQTSMLVLTHGPVDVVEACVGAALRDAAERACPAMVAWDLPLSVARTLGFAVASHTNRHQAMLAGVVAATSTYRAQVRPLSPDDRESVVELQRAVARGHDGGQSRGERAWELLGRLWGPAVEGLVVERSGRLCGYAMTRSQLLTPDVRDLELVDVSLSDQEAARALIRHVRMARPETRTLTWHGARHDRLVEALAELGAAPVDTSSTVSWMRIVDVANALNQRGYVRGRSGVVDFHLDDATNSDNRGLFRLEVQGGRGRLSVGGLGEVRLSVDALAELYSGRRTAQELVRVGRLSGREDGIRQAQQLFAGSTPWISERYGAPWPTQHPNR